MEIKELVNKYGIVGIINNYEINIKEEYVKDLNIKNIDNAFKMVDLNIDIKNKKISELSLSELFKIDLSMKLNNDIIVVGNLSKYLNYKSIEYIKKLLIKLNRDYNKKIIVFDNDVKVFFNFVKRIIVLKNKEVIYETNDFYDEKLYEYTKCPEIIEFINYVNKDKVILNNNIDIYELIKDIFRCVS